MTSAVSRKDAGRRPLVASALCIAALISLSFAFTQQYYLGLGSDEYAVNKEVYVYVSGPPNTAYSLRVYGPGGNLVDKETGETTNKGTSYVRLPGYGTPGGYSIRIEEDGVVIAEKQFYVFDGGGCIDCRPAPRTTTTVTTTTDQWSGRTATVVQSSTSLSFAAETSATAATGTTIEAFSSGRIIKERGEKKLSGKDASGKAVTETVLGEGFNLSSYGTSFELLAHYSSPLTQRMTYRLYNERMKDASYVAISTTGTIRSFRAWHIDEGSVEYDSPLLLMNASGFMDKWSKGEGVLSSIKAFLSSGGVETDLGAILDPSVLPLDHETVYVYRVPHMQGTWEYLEYETDNAPSKMLAFDPAGASWWNDTWMFRQGINITNKVNQNLSNYQVLINLSSSNVGAGFNWTSDQSALRFSYWNESSDTESELNFWIEKWNSTSENAAVWINVSRIPGNMTDDGTGNGSAYVFMYYGNPSASSASNGTKTFIVFDDFSNTTVLTGGTASVSYPEGYDGSVNASMRLYGGGGYLRKATTTNVGRNTIFEVWAKIPSGNPTASLGGVTFGGPASESGGYQAMVDERTTLADLQLREDNNPGQRVSGTKMGVIQTNTWYFLRVAWTSAGNINYTAWENDGLYGGGSGTLFDSVNRNDGTYTTGYAGVGSSDYTIVDQFRARTYIATEPGIDFDEQEYGGRLNATIDLPPEASNYTRMDEFLMNGSVNCTNGNCGETYAWAQYYSAQTPTYTWTDTSTEDFALYNESVNISILNGNLFLETMNIGARWWNQSWRYRQEINISNTAGDLTNYQVWLKLSSSNTGPNLNWSSEENSTRFVYYNSTSGEETVLDYWIELWNSSSQTASVWLKMPYLQNNVNTSIYMYYGGNVTETSLSDPEEVFIFYDDFSNTTEMTGGSATVSYPDGKDGTVNGSILVSGGGANKRRTVVLNSGRDVIFESWFMASAASLQGGMFMAAQTTEASGYQGLVDTTAGSNNLQIKEDYSNGGRVQGARQDLSLNAWYFAKVIWRSTGLMEYYVYGDNGSYGGGSGTLFENINRTDTTYTNGQFGIAAYNSIRMDKYRTRKFASAEPTYTNGSEQELSLKSSGYYISSPYDTSFTDLDYQKVYWTSQTNENTSMIVYTRSSQDNASWGRWWQQTNDSDVYAENYRYIQYLINLSTTNALQSPQLLDMDIEYKVSTSGWDEMSASGTALTTTNPYSCGSLNQTNQMCYPAWTVTARQVGQYVVRIYTNSSYTNTSSIGKNITIRGDTYVVDYAANQSAAAQGQSILLTARLLDDLSSPLSGYNITFGDMTDGTSMGSDLTDSEGYAYLTYSVPGSASIGLHTLNASFNGSETTYLKPSNETTTLTVSSTPKINSLNTTPQTVGFGYNVTIEANVSDDVGLDTVFLNLTTPQGTNTQIELSNYTAEIFQYNYTSAWYPGTYAYFVWANNTDGIYNVSETRYFYVNVSARMEVKTERDQYRVLETVYLAAINDSVLTGLENNGTVNFTGYLYMIIQRENAGAWDFVQAVVNDRAPPITVRNIANSTTLNLSQIWLEKEGWYTDENQPGTYRVYAELTDASGNCLMTSDGEYLNDSYEFELISSEIKLTDLEHENEDEHGINEYEVGDTIDWINITATAYNSTALDVNVTLNLLDQNGDPLGWGPNETVGYGTISENQSVTMQWNNSGAGYAIPLDASSGTYTFYWNVSMALKNGNLYINDSLTFTIHNLSSGFNSSLEPVRIYKPGWTWYNFSFNNTWGSQLSDVNITINCPGATNLACGCGLGGQSGTTCSLATADAGEEYIIPFNVSVESDTASDDYVINITLNYTNPGAESRQWSQVQPQTLEVRDQGILAITISSFPDRITRGEIGSLYAYMNNTAETAASNVWLNYTLPSGWTNSSGALYTYNLSLCPTCILWNNITASIGLSSALGPSQVMLESISDEGQYDWKTDTIDIYANTSIASLQSNDTSPDRGESVRLQATLLYDNGSAISGETLAFYDLNDSVYLGSAVTNSTGGAYITYTIPAGFSLGNHTLNASYNGSGTKYTNTAVNTTTLFVHAKPVVSNVTVSPSSVGFGYNVTITANVSDIDDGIDKVYARIVLPNGTLVSTEMTNNSQQIFEVNYTALWVIGGYNVTVWANDTIGSTNESALTYFTVNATTYVSLRTVNATYGPNSYVNLTSGGDHWWNPAWQYRKGINISLASGSSLTNYQVRINLTYVSGMNNTFADIRFTYYNQTAGRETEVPFWVENYSAGLNATVWVNVSYIPSGSSAYIYVYYGNPNVSSKSNGTTTFEFFDQGSQLSSWTTAGSAGQSATQGNSAPSYYAVSSLGSFLSRNVSLTTNRVIEFDVRSNATGDLFFLANSTGAGQHLRAETRSGFNSGIGSASSWTSWGDPTQTCDNVASDTWHALKLVINSTAAQAYVNDAACGSGYVYTNYGGYVGLVGDQQGASYTSFWDNLRVRKYSDVEPTFTADPEEVRGSRIFNTGSVNISGYLLMQVQYNNSGNWTVISTIINESSTRNIANESSLDLAAIWNQVSWYTSLSTAGTYRVYAELRNPDGAVLLSQNGSVNGTYNFNITAAPVQLNITDISIYNITNNLNTHLYAGALISSGANKTYTLYSGEQYRVEIKVQNLAGSSEWWINLSNISHINLNSSWYVNNTLDVWYSNISDRADTSYVGGNWTFGTVLWNTSKGGVVQAGGNATFYYILNITSGEQTRQVNFSIADPTFVKSDYSAYQIIYVERIPPSLYMETYNLSSVNVTRGQSLTMYARWNETINNATAEYNSTSSTLNNYTISPPYTNDWTNYTISTTSLWLLGNHSAKIFAADINNNWNTTLEYLTFNVWGVAEISESNINASTINASQTVLISCKVRDTTNTSAISGYNVKFYNGTSELGTSTTNSTGWATYEYTDYSPGSETLKCNITGNDTRYYILNANNQSSFALTTRETEAPSFSGLGPGNGTLVHKNDSTSLYAYWTDNYLLDKSWLETNETGSWQNKSGNYGSVKTLSGTGSWSNYTWTNTSFTPGLMHWRIHANDSFGNQNSTGISYLEVWGWAEVSEGSLSTSYMYVNAVTTMTCKVRDANSQTALSGYQVSFYNSTGLMGTNATDATGWASWAYNDSSINKENITCNITDNSTTYYNRTANNYAMQELTTVGYGEDTVPPSLVDETYDVNDTEIYRYESVLVYARWNETISNATAEYNASTSAYETYDIPKPYTNNWTNYTILANSSWLRGIHFVRVMAADSNNVWNNTLAYKNFTVYGRASVDYLSPTGETNRGMVNITCNVSDVDTGQPINGYSVQFYDGATYLGANTTNSSGIALYQWNASASSVGSRTMSCSITKWDAEYYKTATSSDSGSLTLYGRLNVTMVNPVNASNQTKGSTINLNATAKDENGVNQAVTFTWYNATYSSIGSGGNTTWQIPVAYSVGQHMITANASKTYYRTGAGNSTINIWGYANASWTSPNGGVYGSNTIVLLVCYVTDSNISRAVANYPVSFWNSTNGLIGINATNSTGYATMHFNTSTLAQGNYSLTCNITNNATVYYNASASNYGGTNITVDGAAPAVENETRVSSENINYNESINLRVDVYDATLSSVWVRLYRPLSGYVNVSMSLLSGTTYNLTSTKYSYEVGRWNATFYANDSGNNLNYSASTLNWTVWGYSNATWVSPGNGTSYGQGTTLDLVCRIRDANTSSGIQNYPVSFYYHNSTNDTFIYLDTQPTNSTGHANTSWSTSGLVTDNYTVMCNISDNETLYYNRTTAYEANATLIITSGGELEPNLELPPLIPGKGESELEGAYKVGQNRTFILKANVTCRNSSCGTVTGTIRYNQSGTEPDTAIGTSATTPFYIVDSPAQNPKSCVNNPLDEDETCFLNWTVNSTGDIEDVYALDVLFSGSEASSNDSENTNIEISLVLILTLNATSIDWGTQEPYQNCTPGDDSPMKVNVTLNENSNDAAGIYIKGTNLVNMTNYIDIRNVTWCDDCGMCQNGFDVTDDWQLIRSSVSAGTSIYTDYWLDIPSVHYGRYAGEMYVMANASY